MIESMRKQLKSRAFQAMLWVILFSFVAGLLVQITSRTGAVGKKLGSVDGYELSLSDYINKVQQEQRHVQMIKEQLGPDMAQEYLNMQGYTQKPEERVLNSLILEALVSQAAQKVGTHIGGSYIQERLQDQSFIIDALGSLLPQELFMFGDVNMQVIAAHLKRLGISDQEFEDKARQALERSLFVKALAGATYVPKNAITEEYMRTYAKKKYALIIFDKNTYTKKARSEQPTITTKDLEDYLRKHSADYLVPEKRSGKLWSFNAQDYGITPTDKEVQEYYTKHRSKFIQKPEEVSVKRIVLNFTPAQEEEIRKQAQELVVQLRAKPEDFTNVAQKRSQAKERGEVIVFKRGEAHDAQVLTAAFGLAQDNAISDVIRTKDAFIILQRLAKKQSEYKELAQVKDEIKKQLEQEKFPTLFARDAQRVIAQAHDLPDVWSKFITQKNAQESALSGVEKNSTQQARKLFGLKEKGKAFYTEGNKGFIIELASIAKSYVPELATIKERVTNDYYAQKGLELMQKVLEEGHAMLSKETTPDAVAAKLNGRVEYTQLLDPQAQDAWKNLEGSGVPTRRMKLLAQPKAALIEVGDKHGYLIQLLEVEEVKTVDAKKAKEIERGLYQSSVQVLQQALLNNLRQNALIDINTDIVRYRK